MTTLLIFAGVAGIISTAWMTSNGRAQVKVQLRVLNHSNQRLFTSVAEYNNFKNIALS